MKSLKIELQQINFTVGDLEGNYRKIIDAYQKAKSNQVDLIIFSELALTGYFPEDLLLKKYFIFEVEEKIRQLITITKDQKTAILIGAPYSSKNQQQQDLLYNAAFLIENGAVEAISHKTTLPNYGVFDEKRYFTSGITLATTKFRSFNLAILICEDIWNSKNSFLLGDKKIDLIISINASPFSINKANKRQEIVKQFSEIVEAGVVYVNQVGGQDSLVFDGGSFVIDNQGQNIISLKEFREDSAIINLIKKNEQILIEPKSGKIFKASSTQENQEQSRIAKIYSAALLGLRDYVTKNGFSQVLIGMSGGIDSALVAAIAVDALGSGQVNLIALPSQYNSNTSLEDARNCAANLGINLKEISIEPLRKLMLETLEPHLNDDNHTSKNGLVEENLQSRLRGNLLMALSNNSGALLITTGNKSEMATGYATLYGDMCGAYNPIKDIYKTDIFKLAKWRNDNFPTISLYQKINLIPENIIHKAPSAELRFNQKDSDLLPDYEILDAILFNLIEEQKSVNELVNLGFEQKTVEKTAHLLYNSEYKRRQSTLGPKISKMAFDKDRRFPITNRFLN